MKNYKQNSLLISSHRENICSHKVIYVFNYTILKHILEHPDIQQRPSFRILHFDNLFLDRYVTNGRKLNILNIIIVINIFHLTSKFLLF